MAELQLKSLEKTYGNGFKAVHGINLEVKEGETEKDWEKAVRAFSVFYQPAADGRVTALSLRHI